jgi:hypothetical protein
MKVTLYRRHYGVHSRVRESEVAGSFAEWAIQTDPAPGPQWRESLRIREAELIAALPKGFLPVAPGLVLLTVGDATGGTGLVGLQVFRSWAKYFDAYALELTLDESAAALATP